MSSGQTNIVLGEERRWVKDVRVKKLRGLCCSKTASKCPKVL